MYGCYVQSFAKFLRFLSVRKNINITNEGVAVELLSGALLEETPAASEPSVVEFMMHEYLYGDLCDPDDFQVCDEMGTHIMIHSQIFTAHCHASSACASLRLPPRNHR